MRKLIFLLLALPLFVCGQSTQRHLNAIVISALDTDFKVALPAFSLVYVESNNTLYQVNGYFTTAQDMNDVIAAGSATALGAGGFSDPMTTAGDIMYYGASGTTRLAAGTEDYVLKMGATYPYWAAESGGSSLWQDDGGGQISPVSATLVKADTFMSSALSGVSSTLGVGNLLTFYGYSSSFEFGSLSETSVGDKVIAQLYTNTSNLTLLQTTTNDKINGLNTIDVSFGGLGVYTFTWDAVDYRITDATLSSHIIANNGNNLNVGFITGSITSVYTATGAGIGTTTPSERLHVVGNGLFTGNVTADTNFLDEIRIGSPTETSYAFDLTTSKTTMFQVKRNDIAMARFVAEGDDGVLYLYGKIPATTISKISSVGVSYLMGGNLGLGTSSPTEMLHVVGNIAIKDTTKADIIAPDDSTATYFTSDINVANDIYADSLFVNYLGGTIGQISTDTLLLTGLDYHETDTVLYISNDTVYKYLAPSGGGTSYWSLDGLSLINDTANSDTTRLPDGLLEMGVPGVTTGKINFHHSADAGYTVSLSNSYGRLSTSAETFAISGNKGIVNTSSGEAFFRTNYANNTGLGGDSQYESTLIVDGHEVLIADTLGVTITDILRIPPRASAPASPSEGWVYSNSTDHHLYFYNGSTWVQLDN